MAIDKDFIVIGSGVAGFYLLPTLGLPLSLFYMGLINVLTGIIL